MDFLEGEKFPPETGIYRASSFILFYVIPGWDEPIRSYASLNTLYEHNPKT